MLKKCDVLFEWPLKHFTRYSTTFFTKVVRQVGSLHFCRLKFSSNCRMAFCRLVDAKCDDEPLKSTRNVIRSSGLKNGNTDTFFKLK